MYEKFTFNQFFNIGMKTKWNEITTSKSSAPFRLFCSFKELTIKLNEINQPNKADFQLATFIILSKVNSISPS